MIKQIHIKNITAFNGSLDIPLSQLNIWTGDSSSGKTLLLKMIDIVSNSMEIAFNLNTEQSKQNLFLQQFAQQLHLKSKADWHNLFNCNTEEQSAGFSIQFLGNENYTLQLERGNGVTATLPTKPYPFNILGLFNTSVVCFGSENDSLGAFFDKIRHAKKSIVSQRLKAIADKIYTEIQMEFHDGTYQLLAKNGRILGLNRVSASEQRLALLHYVISSGALQVGSVLMIDDPELHLSPKQQKLVADVLFELSQENVQVIIATKSLFFLREMEILNSVAKEKGEQVQQCWVGFNKESGKIEHGEDFSYLTYTPIIDAEIEQMDRFLAI